MASQTKILSDVDCRALYYLEFCSSHERLPHGTL